MQFLGAFAELRKVTINFMSVCLSAWNISTPTGRILMKLDIWAFIEICREKSSLVKVWQE
jgi:hypothetical protein